MKVFAFLLKNSKNIVLFSFYFLDSCFEYLYFDKFDPGYVHFFQYVINTMIFDQREAWATGLKSPWIANNQWIILINFHQVSIDGENSYLPLSIYMFYYTTCKT